MAKQPVKVKVGAQTYKVTTVSNLRDESDILLHGKIYPRECRINILAEQSPGQKKDTILHELLHAIIISQNIVADPEEHEQLVSLLTPPLHALLKDNPDLVRWITSND